MAKIRRQRAKVASPSEVMQTTVGLLTPQEGHQIKSTVIKYQNLKQGSRLYDYVKDCLERLEDFHKARYELQRANYRLQHLLDNALVSKGELSKNNHWKFKLTNKKYATQDGTDEQRIVAADLYCWDTPDEDFTKKLPSYLPREQADSLELGFIDLGDINNPQSNVSSDTAEGTLEGTNESTATGTEPKKTLEELFGNGRGRILELTMQYDKLPAHSKPTFYRDKVAIKDRKDFIRELSETQRYDLHQHARAGDKKAIQDIIDELNNEEDNSEEQSS